MKGGRGGGWIIQNDGRASNILHIVFRKFYTQNFIQPRFPNKSSLQRWFILSSN